MRLLLIGSLIFIYFFIFFWIYAEGEWALQSKEWCAYYHCNKFNASGSYQENFIK